MRYYLCYMFSITGEGSSWWPEGKSEVVPKSDAVPLPRRGQQVARSSRTSSHANIRVKKDYVLSFPQISTPPPLPASRRDLDIPDAFQMTEADQQFLLINDGHDDKILAFATDDNLRYLCEADVIYGDGTFYASPRLFHQIYTIHAIVDGQMFPLVFAFLPDKKEVTYRRMFQLIVDATKTRWFQLDPTVVQMDFETAAKTSALSVFPRAEWKDCVFISYYTTSLCKLFYVYFILYIYYFISYKTGYKTFILYFCLLSYSATHRAVAPLNYPHCYS